MHVAHFFVVYEMYFIYSRVRYLTDTRSKVQFFGEEGHTMT